MFESLIKELEELALAVDFVTTEHAKKICELVNRQVDEKLDAYIIDILWKKAARGGTILLPFITTQRSRRGPAKSHFINGGTSGIWTYVFRNKTPVWFEGIQQDEEYIVRSTADGGIDNQLESGSIKVTRPIENRATKNEIDPDYLIFYENTDAIVTIPLLHRNIIWGVYSVELERYGAVDETTYRELVNLSKWLAMIIWKSDVQRENSEGTNQAITRFSQVILSPPGPVRDERRVGFIARPFSGDVANFERIEQIINECLHVKKAHAAHYAYSPGSGIVIKDIMDQIQRSHFAIVDVTGCKPNIMLELGMIMILDKRFIMLKNKQDAKEMPFDISAYQYYEYVLEEDTVYLTTPGGDRLLIKNMLNEFVENLMKDPAFRRAHPYSE